jgi:methionyl-tRNA formyltransferase
MGTPDFAVPSLDSLVDAGYRPVAVVTAPDRQRGRGRKVSSSPVKEAAVRLGIETIMQPDSVRDELFAAQIAALNADIIVVVAFKILPPAVFSASRFGTFNLHGSLLPSYRGAAPIHRAVMDGVSETGVTTFFLQEKVDTGNVILKRSMPVGPDETTGDVYERMMLLGAQVVSETVELILNGKAEALPQDNTKATPAPKVYSTEARIPWDTSATHVHNHIRGLSPAPGAFTQHGENRLKMYRSTLSQDEVGDPGNRPGTVAQTEGQLTIQCSDGCVTVTELQAPGKKRMETSQFLAGYKIEVGDVLT